MNFWNTFYNLCIKIGKSPNAVAKELDISTGAITWWKKGRVPHPNTAKKVADYFGVSVQYLLTGIEEQSSPIEKENPPQQEISVGEDFVFDLFKNLPANTQKQIIKNLPLDKKKEIILSYLNTVDVDTQSILYKLILSMLDSQ